jgi:nitric oxide reductase NorE protein
MTNTVNAAPPLSSAPAVASRDVAQKPARHLPGDASIWAFVIGDLVIFLAYFIVYTLYRAWNHPAFLQSQEQLSQGLGLLNTLLLLTSSWFVALGAQAAKAGNFAQASRRVAAGGGCGLVFVLVKVFEWSDKISHGLVFTTNDFFMFYYMLTGVHLLHVFLGLGILVFVWRELKGTLRPRVAVLEAGATYWHMVDLLWIVIYALVYLMR